MHTRVPVSDSCACCIAFAALGRSRPCVCVCLQVVGMSTSGSPRCVEVQAPCAIDYAQCPRSVFLAGSIDQDRAEPWQAAFVAAMHDMRVLLLNPRRATWDASLEQSAECAAFREQVLWELDAQDRADVVVLFLAPQSLAPISLLELGYSVRSGKLIVCCDKRFWRCGNVEVMCQRHNIPLVRTLPELVDACRRRLLEIEPAIASS